MEFVLFKSKKKLMHSEIKNIKNKFNKFNSLNSDTINFEWISKDKKTIFVGKDFKIDVNNNYETFNIDQNGNLSFISGWLKKVYENELLIAEKIINLSDFTNIDGFFTVGFIKSNGNGEIYTKYSNHNLFYMKLNDKYAISTSFHILEDFSNSNIKYKVPNIFDGKNVKLQEIYKIPSKSKIELLSSNLIIQEYSNYYNSGNNYFNNPKEFWLDFYNNSLSNVKSFEKILFDSNILTSDDESMYNGEFKSILYYDKGIKGDCNNNWDKKLVLMIRKPHGTLVKRRSGNWFSPISNNKVHFLPSRFKLNIDILQHNSAARIVLTNSERKFISKKFIDLGIPTNGGHLTICYDEGDIIFITDDKTTHYNCDLGSNGIAIRIDLWGGNEFLFKELSIQEL